ncbi:MAG: PIG-L deacetylase family protein [Anaerolineaceae bacterium]|jgi:LmbE family N-acetylglucosaminyl deacetylase
MNVLAIGAHPDDVDFCCGGTLIRMAQQGHRVVIGVVTDGRAHPTGDPEEVAARRRQEAQRSAKLAGAAIEFLGLLDGRLIDDVPTRLKFIDLILRVQPDLIITHYPQDYHADHVMTSRLVTFTIQMAWAPPPELEGQPLRKPVPVAFMMPSNGIDFIPEEYVDVTEVWPTKVQMVLSHKSQYMPGPEFDALELEEPLEQHSFYRLMRVVDEFYGLQCWKKFAETFRWWKAADRLVTQRLLP